MRQRVRYLVNRITLAYFLYLLNEKNISQHNALKPCFEEKRTTLVK